MGVVRKRMRGGKRQIERCKYDIPELLNDYGDRAISVLCSTFCAVVGYAQWTLTANVVGDHTMAHFPF